MSSRARWAATAAALLLGLSLAPLPAQARPATTVAAPAISLDAGQHALIRFRLTGQAALDRLVASGADLAAHPRSDRGGILADVVVDAAQLASLTRGGAVPVQLIQQETHRAVASRGIAVAAADTLHFLQAYWWTTGGKTFLQTQVATTATGDPDVEITVTWTTADGKTGTYPLIRFEDSGEYQYHYALPQPLPGRPVKVTASSSLGGVSRPATPATWPGATPPPAPAGYQKDFVAAYMTPTDIRARIKRLARQYPKLVDVIDLPNRTQGYRRTAVAYLGDPAAAAVVVESVKFGDQGGNGIQVRTVDPGAPNRPLAASYADRVLTVRLATDAAGKTISTTDDVAAVISAKYPQRFRATVETGSAGLPMPVVAPVRLDDGLKGTEVSKKPWTVQALRIGKVRDGSKIGVLAYSQEHAREWATPLVTLEFAERLLANYATDPATRDLVDNVDVFIIPTVNPDGANYSFNDFNFQRKNLVDHCTGASRDPKYRDSWGVDVNRNYTVGSFFDGYVGGSANCLSGTYSGTGELSEAESRNVIALATAHPNIRFAMNVHSYGGYFMWPPGAYRADGRVTLPRPSIDESKFFLDSARRIVGAIAASRGTVTWPAYTGPVADVLYSAAGNSADELYYELGIDAWDFEVGNDRWNDTTQQWEGVGFQPPFDEAHAESQEYAGGLIELVRVARDSQAAVH
ncbi:peptidase M14 [Actinoplanes sp. SE50]|uniref:M14 family zinc carboxypeptidase n=1 Tax=unclassified Actinoplanes TaxID=2626549 RepID=UPI00023EC5A7|nr:MULTISPECIES: M14 family zinc carboxypeptidase [unclassified Actinoplanes]AEV83056.1 carboxypeptidase A1 [Actinoplanes sp. SE50/110]ATO81452.1 peptidase M14 [Actinoplanes sp. SE50]SLL98859.1 peptidase M14 [Actinoplanes sp. SE50/110]